MKVIVIFSLWVLLYGTAHAAGLDRADDLAKYNVVWDSPSRNAHGSMPIGNGDVGINAWVEPSGDLLFYVSKTDAWDENGRLCKIGRVRVTFDPPLSTTGFRQELNLRDGVIDILAGGARLALWVDANAPVVHVDADFEAAVDCRAAVEIWRQRERPFGNDDDSHSSNGLSSQAFKPTVLPDVVATSAEPTVIWYHRNTRSIFPLCLEVQHLESLKDSFADPLLNHTFGAGMSGEGMIRDGDRALKSQSPSRHHGLSITVLAKRAASPEAWLNDLSAIAPVDAGRSRRATAEWWCEFWNRSWVYVEENNGAASAGGRKPEKSILTQGYVLQRFMSACSGRGGSPIKFNGSIFTVEVKPGASPETPDGDPDWRKWGGNYWFQNTRLSYWPMLAAGDCDMMHPWFRMYRDALPLATARVKSIYGFENAAVLNSSPQCSTFMNSPRTNDSRVTPSCLWPTRSSPFSINTGSGMPTAGFVWSPRNHWRPGMSR